MPRKSLIGAELFRKVHFFGQNSGNVENFRKDDNSIEGGAPDLRVIRAGTRLTVHRSLPHGE